MIKKYLRRYCEGGYGTFHFPRTVYYPRNKIIRRALRYFGWDGCHGFWFWPRQTLVRLLRKYTGICSYHVKLKTPTGYMWIQYVDRSCEYQSSWRRKEWKEKS